MGVRAVWRRWTMAALYAGLPQGSYSGKAALAGDVQSDYSFWHLIS